MAYLQAIPYLRPGKEDVLSLYVYMWGYRHKDSVIGMCMLQQLYQLSLCFIAEIDGSR